MTTTVDLNRLTFNVPQHRRTQTLRDALANERATLQAATEPWDRSRAEQNIAKLEGWVEASVANDAARANREAREAAQKSAERQANEERRQKADAELKARLRTEFMAGNPLATDADFERLYPSLRDQHLTRQATAAIDRMRESGRYAL